MTQNMIHPDDQEFLSDLDRSADRRMKIRTPVKTVMSLARRLRDRRKNGKASPRGEGGSSLFVKFNVVFWVLVILGTFVAPPAPVKAAQAFVWEILDARFGDRTTVTESVEEVLLGAIAENPNLGEAMRDVTVYNLRVDFANSDFFGLGDESLIIDEATVKARAFVTGSSLSLESSNGVITITMARATYDGIWVRPKDLPTVIRTRGFVTRLGDIVGQPEAEKAIIDALDRAADIKAQEDLEPLLSAAESVARAQLTELLLLVEGVEEVVVQFD